MKQRFNKDSLPGSFRGFWFTQALGAATHRRPGRTETRRYFHGHAICGDDRPGISFDKP